MELAFAFAVPATVVAGLGVEQRLFAPGRQPRRGEAIAWSTGWLVLAVAVAARIALAGGPAGEWTTVYLIERSLSLDNVFLFSLLLAYFVVPPELRGRAILVGIAGALILRGVAIVAGLALIESVEAIVYVFGLLLLYVAYRAFRGRWPSLQASSGARRASFPARWALLLESSPRFTLGRQSRRSPSRPAAIRRCRSPT